MNIYYVCSFVHDRAVGLGFNFRDGQFLKF